MIRLAIVLGWVWAFGCILGLFAAFSMGIACLLGAKKKRRWLRLMLVPIAWPWFLFSAKGRAQLSEVLTTTQEG